MEYLYGALLLHKAGKGITEEALDKTLSAAGISADKARIKATVAALQGVDINKVLLETPIAAAAPSAPSAPAGGAPAGGAKPKKEEPSEADKAKSEEAAAAGLGALFG